jgi:hypothetical protein
MFRKLGTLYNEFKTSSPEGTQNVRNSNYSIDSHQKNSPSHRTPDSSNSHHPMTIAKTRSQNHHHGGKKNTPASPSHTRQ